MRNKPGQNRWVMDPLPQGPYVLVRQGEEEYFKKNYLKMTHSFEYSFKVEWGFSTWTADINTGLPIMVASDWDTTD